MTGHIFTSASSFAVALSISTIATSFLIKYLVKRNLIKKATDDRWHKNPTPVFGGVGIFIAFAITSLIFLKMDKAALVLLGTSTLMFLTGFIDDLKRISPPAKLTAQIVAASIVVLCGFALPLTGNIYFDKAISLFLIICLTNSFNLLDNMDGLSAGVAIVVLVARGCFFAFDSDWQGLMLTVLLIGSIGGFLIYNHHPAKIFMGDCGSLFIGFSVSTLFVVAPVSGDAGLEKNVLLLTLLAIPLFDTFFVSITRKMDGRKISQGGRDHLSHRLVKAGLSERMAVASLWIIAAVIGFTSFFLYATHEYSTAGIIGAGVVLFAIIFGRCLAKPEKGMGAQANEHALTIVKMFYQFKYKRYILQIIMDVVCIALSYYASYLLRFENLAGSGQLNNFLFSIFMITPTILLFLSLSGVYRGTWKYVTISDIISIYKGIFLGTAVAIFFLAFAFHFEAFSRAVLVNNAIILMVLLPATRASYRIFDELIYKLQDKHKAIRVLIYGAGCNGEYLIRLMKHQFNGTAIIGLIDDDPELGLNTIMGTKVLGTVNELGAIVNRFKIDEILISTNKITEENMRKAIKTVSKTSTKLYKEVHTHVRNEVAMVLAS
jgi:UDP-GlcNAc:undecaprenyl-phosphate GlcNAc-1-phosphate transferase